MQKSARGLLPLVTLCFFLSGVAGLVYQLVWMRYLALFLGHTSYAVVAVLAAFMGGLAIGNAAIGPFADRAKRPLAWYAWLEIAIGLYGLAFPFYFEACREGYLSVARSLASGGAPPGLWLKFLFGLATVLIPAALMGATLPVLTRFLTRSLGELREKVGFLYAINSAGAAAGCIVADFWWIPNYGLEFTVFGAAALNLFAGVVSMLISMRLAQDPRNLRVAEEPVSPTAKAESFTPTDLRWVLVAIALSGAVAMLYEVTWTRLLALALGSSTHAFSIMLLTFISGIAFGAWLVSRWNLEGKTLRAFGWAELALGTAVFVSMFFYDSLPFWFARLASLLARREDAFVLYQLFQAALCFAVMFIPTVCLGVTLPLASRIATGELARTGRSVGRVFAVNTLGTVLGTILSGLWLLPHLGLARTFAVGAGLNALIGIALLNREKLTFRSIAGGAFGLVVFVWVAGVMFADSWQKTLSLGIWRRESFTLSKKEFREMARLQNLPYHRDGAGATVAVYSDHDGEKERLSLKVNGKADAGTDLDVSTQRLLGHIPMLLRTQSERVLVVGLGSGMTAAAVARHEPVKQVDVVEISPEVVEAASYFHAHNDDVLKNPRVRVVVDDAKSFLQITPQRYDVIISEPSNPWMAGVAGVFSREYYQNCRDRLAPDGLMVQWVQTYETNDETLDLVLRTFTSVFPHLSVWQPSISDLVLVGSVTPQRPDLAAFLQRFEQKAIRSDMERFELDQPLVLLSREIVPAITGAFMVTSDGPIQSDYFPELEYRAQRGFFVHANALRWLNFDATAMPRPATLLGEYLARRPLTETDCKAIARYFLRHRVPTTRMMLSVLHRWQGEWPQSSVPLELASQMPEHGSPAELEAARFRPRRDALVERAAKDPVPLRLWAGFLMQAYRTQRSAFYTPPAEEIETVLRLLVATDAINRRSYQLQLAELAWDRGDDAAALALARPAFALDPAKPEPLTFHADPAAPGMVLRRLLESALRSGDMTGAREWASYAVLNGYARQDALIGALCRRVNSELAKAGGQK